MSSSIPVISFPEDLPPATYSATSKQHQTLRFLIRLLYSSGYTLAGIYLIAILALKPLLNVAYDRRSEFLNHVYTKLSSVYNDLTTKVKYVPSVEINYKGVIYKDSMSSTDDFKNDNDSDEEPIYTGPTYRYSAALVHEPVKEVRFLDDAKNINYNELNSQATMKLTRNLNNLKETLNDLKVSNYNNTKNFTTSSTPTSFGGRNNDVSEMQPLMFQMKQLKNYIEIVSSDHPRDYIFKRKLNYSNRYIAGEHKKNSLNLLDDLNDEINELKDAVKSINHNKPS
ncbi:hypothetical protein CANARDRAFT_27848 [[Candida] arabinofermentans NRRL YB-2248]|uniref:Uncharacterized protein n=1 Tax=[Candida] arabinofermentans NRRL YB-2248 TaxID=983967 RepID=A0A1E4T1Z1_9ASCO|nr:hypothetical protein CANARDRAFT_27848 [[Candida] arabinofermentans NRRL YB-2248]